MRLISSHPRSLGEKMKSLLSSLTLMSAMSNISVSCELGIDFALSVDTFLFGDIFKSRMRLSTLPILPAIR